MRTSSARVSKSEPMGTKASRWSLSKSKSVQKMRHEADALRMSLKSRLWGGDMTPQTRAMLEPSSLKIDEQIDAKIYTLEDRTKDEHRCEH